MPVGKHCLSSSYYFLPSFVLLNARFQVCAGRDCALLVLDEAQVVEVGGHMDTSGLGALLEQQLHALQTFGHRAVIVLQTPATAAFIQRLQLLLVTQFHIPVFSARFVGTLLLPRACSHSPDLNFQLAAAGCARQLNISVLCMTNASRPIRSPRL
jgi:hypothetical protein